MTRTLPSVLTSSFHRSVAALEKQSEMDITQKVPWTLIIHSYDYTKGKLGELIDIIIDSGTKLFGERLCSYHRQRY